MKVKAKAKATVISAVVALQVAVAPLMAAAADAAAPTHRKGDRTAVVSARFPDCGDRPAPCVTGDQDRRGRKIFRWIQVDSDWRTGGRVLGKCTRKGGVAVYRGRLCHNGMTYTKSRNSVTAFHRIYGLRIDG